MTGPPKPPAAKPRRKSRFWGAVKEFTTAVVAIAIAIAACWYGFQFLNGKYDEERRKAAAQEDFEAERAAIEAKRKDQAKRDAEQRAQLDDEARKVAAEKLKFESERREFEAAQRAEQDRVLAAKQQELDEQAAAQEVKRLAQEAEDARRAEEDRARTEREVEAARIAKAEAERAAAVEAEAARRKAAEQAVADADPVKPTPPGAPPEGDDLLVLADGRELRGRLMGVVDGVAFFDYRDEKHRLVKGQFAQADYTRIGKGAFRGVSGLAPESPADPGGDFGKLERIDTATQVLLYPPKPTPARAAMVAAGAAMARRLREFGYDGITSTVIRDPSGELTVMLTAKAWTNDMASQTREFAGLACTKVEFLHKARPTGAQQDQYSDPSKGAPAGMRWVKSRRDGPLLVMGSPVGTLSSRKMSDGPRLGFHPCRYFAVSMPASSHPATDVIAVVDGARLECGALHLFKQGVPYAPQEWRFRTQLAGAEQWVAIAIQYPLPFAFAK